MGELTTDELNKATRVVAAMEKDIGIMTNWHVFLYADDSTGREDRLSEDNIDFEVQTVGDQITHDVIRRAVSSLLNDYGLRVTPAELQPAFSGFELHAPIMPRAIEA